MTMKCLLVILGCAELCLANLIGVWNGTSCICNSAERPLHPRPFYELFPQLGYYKLHTNPKTWYDAKQICENEGAHLTIINSVREARVLEELRRRLPAVHGDWRDDSIYIGMNDIEDEGVWKTIFNDPLSSTGFNTWDRNQPDNGASGNCGLFRPSTSKLHDISCTAQLPFYCELEV